MYILAIGIVEQCWQTERAILLGMVNGVRDRTSGGA